jgi:hypothetical protein
MSEPTPRRRSSSAVWPWLAAALSSLVIAAVQPKLAGNVARVKQTSDAYALPPPEQVLVASLGYRAAVADMLWAYVLVAQGLRMGEHRAFEHAARYFETIFTLEPTYRRPYLFADTILTFGAKVASLEDLRATRRIFERGVSVRPYDPELHLQAGNFIAYIAPPHLPEGEQTEWRLFGGKLLARAAELGTGKSSLQWHSLMGAKALSRSGERQAAISFLERTYAITEDEDLRKQVLVELRALNAEEAASRAKRSADRFEQTWRNELPFVSRSKILLLGPKPDPFACAGPGHETEAECIRDWHAWTERQARSTPSAPAP